MDKTLLVRKLKCNGLSNVLAKEVAYSKSNLAKRLREFYLCDSCSRSNARLIMGKNFFGNREAAKYLGINFTITLSRIPFSENQLEKQKHSHMLIADPGISIAEIVKAKNKIPFAYPEQIKDDSFMRETDVAKWSLISLKNGREKENECPSARKLFYFYLCYFSVKGVYPIYVKDSPYAGTMSNADNNDNIAMMVSYNQKFLKIVALCYPDSSDPY